RLGIDGAHALDRRAGFDRAAFALVLLVQRRELLQRLALALFPGEQIGQREAHVVLLWIERRELLQRAKRFVEIAGLLHPVGIFEEVLAGIGTETLPRRNLAEFVVDAGAPGRLAEDLV